MIDFHAHILPGIDDGSRDIEMTEAMLREEKKQGIDLVVATPHFLADVMTIGGFMESRAMALEKTELLRQRTEAPLPAIVLGAEVCYFRDMGSAKAVERLCVGQTRTMLLELPLDQWDEGVLRDVETLIEKRGLNIVLAHIERYPQFQRDRDVFNRVMALPVTLQINAGSLVRKENFLKRHQKRLLCLKFLKEYDRIIVSTDCHNMTSRRPNLLSARNEIESALGTGVLAKIDDTARRALE